jgi:RHS repeat-associated protein
LSVSDTSVRCRWLLSRTNIGEAQDGTYDRSSVLAPITLGYSQPIIEPTIHHVDPESLANLPGELDGKTYQLLDLDGEGLPGILTQQAGAMFYKRNEGDGHFGSMARLATKPSIAEVGGGFQQITDLDGGGAKFLVQLGRSPQGYSERQGDSWGSFQLDNHLGSAALEVDDAANLLSYEEYHPYGTTAYRATAGVLDTNAKRYAFTGKEREEETGFTYHGARYYAPWLGRWTSVDPAGQNAAQSRYAYVSNRPLLLTDQDGRAEDLPNRRASPQVLAKLQEYEDEGLPILQTIKASPTLRPADVELAASAGGLTDFGRHPGTSFLGAVGEALVIHDLLSPGGNSPTRNLSSFAIANPATSMLPPVVRPVVGSTLPDILAVQIAFEQRVGPIHVEQRVHWNDVVARETGGRVGDMYFNDNAKVVSLFEVTVSAQPLNILERAEKVAAWAAAASKLKVPAEFKIAAVLGIDRGVFFQLPEAERQSLVKTVTSAGGYIALFRDLRSTALEDARIIAAGLKSVAPPVSIPTPPTTKR